MLLPPNRPRFFFSLSQNWSSRSSVEPIGKKMVSKCRLVYELHWWWLLSRRNRNTLTLIFDLQLYWLKRTIVWLSHLYAPSSIYPPQTNCAVKDLRSHHTVIWSREWNVIRITRPFGPVQLYPKTTLRRCPKEIDLPSIWGDISPDIIGIGSITMSPLSNENASSNCWWLLGF